MGSNVRVPEGLPSGAGLDRREAQRELVASAGWRTLSAVANAVAGQAGSRAEAWPLARAIANGRWPIAKGRAIRRPLKLWRTYRQAD